MCDALQVGDIVTMSLPYGDVVLDDSGRPVVFASAGVGITPMAGILSHLAAAGSGLEIMLLHADEHEGPSPCAGRWSAMSSRYPTRRYTSGTRTGPATSRSTGCTPG